jgi:small subunit ribosomal protein S17
MKIFTGSVIATKAAKTAVVSVERVVIHPLYKKRFRRHRKYQVHDELGVNVGQLVRFAASKPYSKTKKWKILETVGDKNLKTQELKNSMQIKIKSSKVEKKGAIK